MSEHRQRHTATSLVVPRTGVSQDLKTAPRNEQDLQQGFPEHLRRSRKYYRFGYLVVVTGVLALTFTTPRTFAREANGSLTESTKWSLAFMALFCLVSYFLLQGTDPGYLTLDMEHRSLIGSEQQEQEQQVRVEMVNVELQESREETEIDLDGDDDDDDNSSLSSSSSDEFELEIEPDEPRDAELSHVATNQVPMRAKYCRNSKRYVATYDHFCGVLGTCIGEKNHFRFWWFLLFHTLGIIFLLRVVHSGFRDTKAEVLTWIDYNGHALGAAIFLWILLATVGGLLIFHTFLACANMTSYEFLRADRISYLKGSFFASQMTSGDLERGHWLRLIEIRMMSGIISGKIVIGVAVN